MFIYSIGSVWVAESIASPGERQNFNFHSYLSSEVCEIAIGMYIPGSTEWLVESRQMPWVPLSIRGSVVVARVRHHVVDVPGRCGW